MAQLNSPLLTIAIPTYNRSQYLRRCLTIIHQQQYNSDEVEIIVSDNASADDTEIVVNNVIENGLNVKYIKNEENKGPDLNIQQCYLTATGQYVIALSDDDILLDGAIARILQIIHTNDYGVIFLNHFLFKDSLESNQIVNKNAGFDVYHNHQAYINRVNYNLTLISGNIINKKYLINYSDDFIGTYLVQFPIILNCALKATNNVFVNDMLLAVQTENTGGYNIIKVFVVNFIHLINDVQLLYSNIPFKKYFTNSMLLGFLPMAIIKCLNKESSFDFDSVYTIKRDIKSAFSESLYSKLLNPLFSINKHLRLPYFYLFIKPFAILNKVQNFNKFKNSYKKLMFDAQPVS